MSGVQGDDRSIAELRPDRRRRGDARHAKKISKLNAAADRAAHWSILRIVLAIVAVQVIAFALPALVLGEEQQTGIHAARHLGAFEVAYGVALLVVVVRPARAR